MVLCDLSNRRESESDYRRSVGALEYFDFSDLPFSCSLALLQVYAGIKQTDSCTDRNTQKEQFKGLWQWFCKFELIHYKSYLLAIFMLMYFRFLDSTNYKHQLFPIISI